MERMYFLVVVHDTSSDHEYANVSAISTTALGRPVSIWHPLDGISVVGEEHDRDSGQLPDPPLEVLVAGGHDVGLVLGHPVHQAVVGVGALVQAGQSLEPGGEEVRRLETSDRESKITAKKKQYKEHMIERSVIESSTPAFRELGIEIDLHDGCRERGVEERGTSDP